MRVKTRWNYQHRKMDCGLQLFNYSPIQPSHTQLNLTTSQDAMEVSQVITSTSSLRSCRWASFQEFQEFPAGYVTQSIAQLVIGMTILINQHLSAGLNHQEWHDFLLPTDCIEMLGGDTGSDCFVRNDTKHWPKSARAKIRLGRIDPRPWNSDIFELSGRIGDPKRSCDMSLLCRYYVVVCHCFLVLIQKIGVPMWSSKLSKSCYGTLFLQKCSKSLTSPCSTFCPLDMKIWRFFYFSGCRKKHYRLSSFLCTNCGLSGSRLWSWNIWPATSWSPMEPPMLQDVGRNCLDKIQCTLRSRGFAHKFCLKIRDPLPSYSIYISHG